MLRELNAKNGYVFATKDKKEIYGNILYLGIYDSQENYIQITIDEAADIIKSNIEQEIKNHLDTVK